MKPPSGTPFFHEEAQTACGRGWPQIASGLSSFQPLWCTAWPCLTLFSRPSTLVPVCVLLFKSNFPPGLSLTGVELRSPLLRRSSHRPGRSCPTLLSQGWQMLVCSGCTCLLWASPRKGNSGRAGLLSCQRQPQRLEQHQRRLGSVFREAGGQVPCALTRRELESQAPGVPAPVLTNLKSKLPAALPPPFQKWSASGGTRSLQPHVPWVSREGEWPMWSSPGAFPSPPVVLRPWDGSGSQRKGKS